MFLHSCKPMEIISSSIKMCGHRDVHHIDNSRFFHDELPRSFASVNFFSGVHIKIIFLFTSRFKDIMMHQKMSHTTRNIHFIMVDRCGSSDLCKIYFIDNNYFVIQNYCKRKKFIYCKMYYNILPIGIIQLYIRINRYSSKLNHYNFVSCRIKTIIIFYNYSTFSKLYNYIVYRIYYKPVTDKTLVMCISKPIFLSDYTIAL